MKLNFYFLTLTGILTFCFSALSEEHPSITEHVYGGLPSNYDLIIRKAYVMDYDFRVKAPRWVAYHLVPDYRNVPVRKKWGDYLNDPDRDDEPSEADYEGVFQDPIRGYARGHLAPYMIAGGDRDGDGLLLDPDGDGVANDEDEQRTVEEINYHTNLTPQHHNAFNGSGGIWYKIEKRIRDILPAHGELWVFCGPIFGPSKYDIIGDGVEVAPMFFQIIIWEDENGAPEFEAYMMPHHQKAHGKISDHLVSIRHIEAMAGLDFFPKLEHEKTERASTYD